MRGVRAPLILAVSLFGFLVLIYKQHDEWLDPNSGLHLHLGNSQVYYDSDHQDAALPPQVPEEPEKPRLPGFCEYCGPEDLYCKRYGHFNLARSRSYEGPATRLKRILRKAASGQHIKIGIIGGSVTKGHGVSHSENWTTQLLEWWQTTFPNASFEIKNGAVGGTISTYIETCFGEHIDEDVDLVIIEMAINDQRLEFLAKSYENIIRVLFDLPSNPAVLHLQIAALSFASITMGGDLHLAVAQYYDTPVINVRNVILPHILKTTEQSLTSTSVEDYWFHHNRGGDIDLRHMNLNGHRLCADMLNAFVQKVYCEVLREDEWNKRNDGNGNGSLWGYVAGDEEYLPSDMDGEYVPRLRLFQPYDHNTIVSPSHPSCQTIEATKHPLTPVPPSHGFSKWAHPNRPDKPFLRATQPGDIVLFELTTSSVGRIRVTYQRSKDYGLGSCLCWVDDEKTRGVRLDGWWNVENRHTASTTDITTTASPGPHVLSCEVMKETKDPGGGTEFRIIAVDAL